MGRPFPTCPVPASRPPGKQHRKLLTPSDNAQRRTHFHKYKARGVGPRGRQKWGGCPPYPQHRVSGPTSPRFPPALKIVLAAASQVPLATSFWIGNSVRSLEGSRLGLPPHPHNSKLSSKEAGRPSWFSLGVPSPRPTGIERLALRPRHSAAGHNTPALLQSQAALCHKLGWGRRLCTGSMLAPWGGEALACVMLPKHRATL